jgi:hypothetical protein
MLHGVRNGSDARFLIDSGATNLFVNKAWLHSHGKGNQIDQSNPRNMRLASGSIVPCYGTTTIQVQMGTYTDTLVCYVMKLTPTVDVILGKPWLKRFNPHVDYGTLSNSHTKANRYICVALRTEVTSNTTRTVFYSPRTLFYKNSTTLRLTSN